MTEPRRSQAQAADLGLIEDLVMSYRGAHALMAGVTLGVFDALGREPRSARDVARSTSSAERPVEVLLDALAALGFLEKNGDRFRNAPVAEQYLTSGGASGLVNNLRYLQLLAGPWARLPEIVRSGEPAVSLPDLLADRGEFVESYIWGMADISRRPAGELAGHLELSHARFALDVGGGSGVYAEALAARSPHLRVTVLDLPPTLKIARERLADSAIRERVELREGDYHTADFGSELFDLVLFSHVLHDEGEGEAQRLLKKAFSAMKRGGEVVVHDFMPASDRAGPLFPALFSLHMLVYTRKGRAYSADEYEAWLRECGFVKPRRAAICAQRPTATVAVIAEKP